MGPLFQRLPVKFVKLWNVLPRQVNKSISRILYPDLISQIVKSEILNRDGDHSSSPTVARLDQAIYPEVVSRVIGIRAGSPVDASLFDLALRGVCLAACVTTRAGALLL